MVCTFIAETLHAKSIFIYKQDAEESIKIITIRRQDVLVINLAKQILRKKSSDVHKDVASRNQSTKVAVKYVTISRTDHSVTSNNNLYQRNSQFKCANIIIAFWVSRRH